MAMEFARRCAQEGAAVLVGRADQDALLPYRPFVEALTWYVRACPQPDLMAQLDALGGGGELAWIVPELQRLVRDLPVPAPVSPESQRYRLFEVVSELLIRASASHPVLLLVDDLHWADKATVQLMRHLLRRPDRSALCVVLRRAVALAKRIGDPALLLPATTLLVALDGNDGLAADARLLVERIAAALPDPILRQRFLAAEAVTRLRSS